MATNRSHRLRKKLHLGEFAECGFEVYFGKLDHDCEIQLLVSLSIEVLEPSGMSFFYLNNGRIFISSLNSSLTNNDRQLVNDWLKKQQNIPPVFEVGCLVDAWHPPRGVRCFSSGRGTMLLLLHPAL